MNKKAIITIKVVISLILIFYLINKIGVGNILENFIKINLYYIFPILLLWVTNLFIGALNIQIMIRAFKEKIPLTRVIKHYIKSWACGLFLPGKLGELSLIYFLKKDNIELSKGTIISVFDKIITFVVLLGFSVWGLMGLINLQEGLMIITTIFFIFIVIWFFFGTNFGRIIIKKYILRNHSWKFKNFYKNLHYLISKRKRFLILNLFITIIKWVVIFIIIYLLFKSLNYTVDIASLVSAVSIGLLISLIPISISGLGVRETSSLAMFVYYNVPSTIAGSVLLLQTIIRYIIGIVVILY